jgi:hypothetical protein
MAGKNTHPTRGWQLFAVRLLLAVLGVFAVLIGFRNAWHSHVTAAPLTLGGFLILLALLLDPSVSEISGGYKDAQLKVVRGRFLNAASLIRTASGMVVDAETKAQLELIADEVEREPVARARRRTALQALVGKAQRFIFRDDDTPKHRTASDEPFAEDETEDVEARTAFFEDYRAHYDWAKDITDWGIPEPFHYFVYAESSPEGKQPLRINTNVSWWGDWRLEVHARDPQGRTSAQILYGSTGMQQNTYYFKYPFADSPTIEDSGAGEYVFTWRRLDADRTVMRRDTVVVTDEMLDPNVLEGEPDVMPGYKSVYWSGEVPVERKAAGVVGRPMEVRSELVPIAPIAQE